MTRKNPEKLSVKYPVVKRLKEKMKYNKEFTEDHIKGFDRRVRDHTLMMFMIEYMQELDNTAEEGVETKHRNDNLKAYMSIAEERRNKLEEAEKTIEELKKTNEKLIKFIEDKKWDEMLEDSDEEV